jgi:hypothetical protein
MMEMNNKITNYHLSKGVTTDGYYRSGDNHELSLQKQLTSSVEQTVNLDG